MQERALMLDMARKFFTKEWIFKLIDYLEELQFNTLQLHFSENEGFRIQSELYPHLMSKEYLTKQDLREIISYANNRGIAIIPDFDTPGHLQQILKFYPTFQLEKMEEGQTVKDPRSLNIANPEARTFIKSLIKEFATLFQGSQYFHIGADEFIDFDQVEAYPQLVDYAKKHYGDQATGMETYIEYTNELIDYVIELGFTPRVWNDGFYRNHRTSLIELDPRVQITYWTKWHPNMAPVIEFLHRGHPLINFNDHYFYYVLGENASYKYPTAEHITSHWQIEKFAGDQSLTQEQLKSVIGTSFAIWCDLPDAQTQEEVFAGIKEPLKAMADKLGGITHD